jgi:uncharacterized protein YbbC (DUF1343 family)
MFHFSCSNSNTNSEQINFEINKEPTYSPSEVDFEEEIVMGAQRTKEYFPLIEGKRIGLVVNQTSIVGKNHLVDALISRGQNLVKVFAPEHGFRGKADAGEHVKDDIDVKTGLPIISLHGKNKKPSQEHLADVDVMIFDIQDVGARFYTYISTLSYVMDACAEKGIKIIVMDRPNPNGHYVDGPILEKEFSSFVGLHEIPIVHGMTIGEFAQLKNEQWSNGNPADLVVVKMLNYTHNTRYELPIKPSPNLPNIKSILLYPSICLLEGTTLSLGRGTNQQFQVYGHPELTNKSFQFTPKSGPGSKYPKHENVTCYGRNLAEISLDDLYAEKRINLSYVLETYKALKGKLYFLENNFFNTLAGNDELMQQIIDGKSEEEIRASWQAGLDDFKVLRKKHLLYPDFE